MKHIAGGVIYNLATNKIAVVNQNNDSWSLPKGHVEANEAPRDAALREIWEETGIPHSKLTEIAPLGFYERTKIKRSPEDPDKPRTITLYLYTTTHEELAPHDAANPRAIWVDPESVSAILTHPKDKTFFDHSLPLIKRYIERVQNSSSSATETTSEKFHNNPNISEEEHGHQHERPTI